MKDPGRDSDTIAAVSTPPGKGAIAVVRMSGANALEISREVFVQAREKKVERLRRGFYVGRVYDPARKRDLDQVVLLVMPGPGSYTGEDVVEFHCHGGRITPQLVLRTIIESGARQAERGEFTLRAFLNGRLDLLQAESILDIIESRTEIAQSEALRRMEGSLSGIVNDLRSEIVELSARLEYVIDFPEEDDRIEGTIGEEEKVASLIRLIDDLLEAATDGEALNDGVLTVIAGTPNVGKSSLFNLLCSAERAIVTSVPGTTRDAIEATVEIGELPLRLVDTAGLRHSNDQIEQLGMEFSHQYLEKATLILFVLEANRNIFKDEAEFIEKYRNKCVAVVNKLDLGLCIETNVLAACRQMVTISCVRRIGIESLKNVLCKEAARVLHAENENPVLVRARYRAGLVQARDALTRFRTELDTLPPEILSMELRDARESLEELTGEVTREEILKKIFSEFCVGK